LRFHISTGPRRRRSKRAACPISFHTRPSSFETAPLCRFVGNSRHGNATHRARTSRICSAVKTIARQPPPSFRRHTQRTQVSPAYRRFNRKVAPLQAPTKHVKLLPLVFNSLQRHEALLKRDDVLETEKNGRFIRSVLARQRTRRAPLGKVPARGRGRCCRHTWPIPQDVRTPVTCFIRDRQAIAARQAPDDVRDASRPARFASVKSADRIGHRCVPQCHYGAAEEISLPIAHEEHQSSRGNSPFSR
jgi:hypothetical protein